MIKAGDKVNFEQSGQRFIAVVKTGPYPKEYQVMYPDNTPTTFIEDAYDLELENGGRTIEGVRRRYLKKIKEAVS